MHYIGLDVHKESIAVAIAPQDSGEVRKYGIIGGTLDAVDKLLKRLQSPDVELRFVYEAGPCGYVLSCNPCDKGTDMHIALAQQGSFHVAKLVETESAGVRVDVIRPQAGSGQPEADGERAASQSLDFRPLMRFCSDMRNEIYVALITVFALPGLSSVGWAGEEYAGKPYGGLPRQIPGIIQAEHYDVAPTNTDGITFHYNRPARNAAFRTTGDCIGLTRYGNGHVTIAGAPEDPNQVYLGYTHAGEWVKYSVHVAEPGTYQFGGKFAAAFTNAVISVTFTPGIKTGPITIPTTAGYQPGVEVYHVWEKLDNLDEIKLPAGDLIMTVKIENENAGGMNIDYFSFTKKP